MERFSFVWFDLNGRIGRRTWLIYAALLALAGYVTEDLIRRGLHVPELPVPSDGPFFSAYLGDEVSLLSALIFLWPSLAIDVKRWHDLGRSGWNTLIVYVPAIILFALRAKGLGGTSAHPDPWAAAFLSVFGLVLIGYFIILAARKGIPAANRFGAA